MYLLRGPRARSLDSCKPVPQLISPWHVETFMAARRIKESGLGLPYDMSSDQLRIEETVELLTSESSFQARAKTFSRRVAVDQKRLAADAVIESLDHTEAVAAA